MSLYQELKKKYPPTIELAVIVSLLNPAGRLKEECFLGDCLRSDIDGDGRSGVKRFLGDMRSFNPELLLRRFVSGRFVSKFEGVR